MTNLLMISGFGARDAALKKKGAFFETLQGFRVHWDHIDILAPGKKWLFSRAASVEIFGNVVVHISPVPLWLHPWWIKTKGKKLAREHRYDIMTVHEYPPFYNGIAAKKLHRATGLPYILEIMHIPGYPRPANMQERLYCWLMKKHMKSNTRHARAVRVINQKQIPEFLIAAGVDKNKIVYIPAFYIDLEQYAPKKKEKQYDVIAIARLEENKGLILLIDALQKLKRNFKAVIVGDGRMRRRLEKEVENYNMKDKVIFTGWLENDIKISMLQRSSLLVMTSYNEGGPRVTLEAMACGVPVLATRVGVMMDIVQDGHNALFIDWNPHDIAEKMTKILDDAHLRERLSVQGLETVRQFEKKQAIKNYADQIKQLIQ